jgi:ribonuclease HI
LLLATVSPVIEPNFTPTACSITLGNGTCYINNTKTHTHTHQLKFKLHAHCSNNQAEQVAILKALEKLEKLQEGQDNDR